MLARRLVPAYVGAPAIDVGAVTGPSRILTGEFANRYVIERELGRGATATVYLARDTTYSRPVAIKLLRSELAGSMDGERFLREIRLTAQLHHPNILSVLDSGSHEDKLFVVFPYMDGGSLRDRLTAEKQLPIDEVVRIGTTIARALAHAHEKGLLHRDVKPENIVFGAGQPCLADFGIARALVSEPGERTTTTGVVRGTPAYMSPEQASAERELDGRSDVYSLACVLYEAIAGVPAFVGPTPQSVIAQRFSHAPRPASVYRPTIPSGVDAVLQRALQIAPADRFLSAREFADALEAGLATPPATAAREAERRGRRLRRGIAVLAGLFVVGAALAVFEYRSQLRASPDVAADTTRIAVLPVEGIGGTHDPSDDALLYAALSQWSGISLIDQFTIEDAIRQRGSGEMSASEAGRIATAAGAGRYVRARMARAGESTLISAALFDVRSPRPLFAVSSTMTAGDNPALAFQRVAAELLLRKSRDSADAKSPPSRSVPAMQAFAAGIAALSEWDLATADSAFQASARFDSAFVRPVFWSAQVRAWSYRPDADWKLLAQRAADASPRLPDRERALASALAALGRGAYAESCAQYAALRDRNPRDFAAWFGLGQCRDLDRVVLPDRRSPTAWRFRSSYADALAAYGRALELLPSSYRGFQHGSYETLQRIFVTSANVTRSGVATGDSTEHFLARASLDHDTLRFLPVPIRQMLNGQAPADLSAARSAIEYGRRAFYELTRSWSLALPTNAGTKEAFAVALELVGDPTSLDTLRAARRLAETPNQRLRLASAEVLLGLKLSLPDGARQLRTAAALADSLLRDANPAGRDAQYLAPLAALLGRCGETERLTGEGTVEDTRLVAIPAYLRKSANELTARIALGCVDAKSATAAAGSIADQVTIRDRQGTLMAYTLLGPSLRLIFPPDAGLVTRLAAATNSYLLSAERALLVHDTAGARQPILRVEATREALGEPATADALYAEAHVLLASGDTTSAIRILETNLGAMRRQPILSVENPTLTVARVACLIRAAKLLADLTRVSDPQLARRWQAAYDIVRSAPATSR